MAKSKQRQSLRGAVLIMVLTVMVVLIIMLMATLTVVTTAGQRVYTKFEENQAYYTARSALDVFTANMLNDNTYYAYDTTGIKSYSYTAKDTAGNEKIFTGSDAADMKQGLALQGEIYKIKSQGENAKKIVDKIKADTSHPLYSTVSTMSDDDAKAALGIAENMIYDPGTLEVFGKVSGVTAPENEFFSVAMDTSKKPNLEYIEYTVTLPETGSTGNEYGLMVDEDASGTQDVTIKVEVLDRIYNMNPPMAEDAIIAALAADYKDPTVVAAIKAGDRSKDKIRLKITATATFMDTEGTAVLIYDSSEPKTVPSSRAVVSLNSSSNGDSMIPIGGVSTLSKLPISYQGDSVVTGSTYYQGDFGVNASNKIHLDGSIMMSIREDFKPTNGVANPFVVHEPGAVIFVGGTFYDGFNNAFNAAGQEVNIVAKDFVVDSSNAGAIYGNIFCESIDVSKANLSNFTILNGRTYTNTIKCQGLNFIDLTDGVYSFSVNLPDISGLNASLSKNTITIYTAQNWLQNHGWGAGTDIVEYYEIEYNPQTNTASSAKIVHQETEYDASNVVTSDTKTETAIDVSTAVNLTFAGGNVAQYTPDRSDDVNLDWTDYTTNKLEAGYRIFELPANLLAAPGGTPDDELQIPTVEALYGSYFDNTTFVNGEFDPAADTNSDGEIDDTELAAFVAAHVITSEAKLSLTTLDKYTNEVVVESRDADAESAYPAAEQIPATFSKVIKGSGRLKSFAMTGINYNDYDLVAIDARSGPVELQFSGDDVTTEQLFGGKFVVFGDNEVNIYVAGSQTVNIGGQGNNPFQIYSAEIYNLTSSSYLELGNVASPAVPTSAPKVNIYVASTVPTANFGTNSFVTGYFYMPRTQFGLPGGVNGIQYETNYNGYYVGKNGYAIIGSVLCNGYTSEQDVGVAYIDPGASNYKHGEPILDWLPVQYARK